MIMTARTESATAVPNRLIDEYLTKAKPEYLAVYIYGLRHRDGARTVKKTAEDLSMREMDVISAWVYWEAEELVRITDGSIDGFAYDFPFDFPGAFPEASADDADDADDSEENEAAAYESIAEKPQDYVRVDNRPSYTVAEIERVTDSSEDVRYLYKMAEKIMGKPLTYNEMNLFLGFHDWLLLPVQVIEVLLDYCVSNNHKNGRYLEKVAMNWADNGIKTVEDAEEYIKTLNVDYREIMKAFGQARRDPSSKEIAYMKKWLREYKLPLELIVEACGKTVLQTGGTRFAYADKILENWYNNEITTLEEAAAYDSGYKKDKEAKTAEKGKPRQKSRFANYKGREWDYDKLEKLAQDYVENSL